MSNCVLVTYKYLHIYISIYCNEENSSNIVIKFNVFNGGNMTKQEIIDF
jgi:hypothetical protein